MNARKGQNVALQVIQYPQIPFGDQTVSQEELEYLAGLRNQIDQLRSLYLAVSEKVARKILAGCAVEFGTHVARVVERWRGGRRVQDLIVR